MKKKKKMVGLGEKHSPPYFKIFFPFYFHSNQIMENHIFLRTFSNLTFHPISCYFFLAWSKWNSSCIESSCNCYWLLKSSDSSPTYNSTIWRSRINVLMQWCFLENLECTDQEDDITLFFVPSLCVAKFY